MALLLGFLFDENFGLIGVIAINLALILFASYQEKLSVVVPMTLGSFLSIQFFFAEPKFSFAMDGMETWLVMIAYASSALIISLVFNQRGKKYNNLLTLKNRFFSYLIALILFTLINWLSKKFHNPSIEQFIFHFEYSDKLFDEFDKSLFRSFFKNVILVPLGASILIVILEDKLRKIYFENAENQKNKLLKILNFLLVKRIPIYLVLLSFAIAFINFGVQNYIDTKENNRFIEKNYIDPKKIEIKAVAPKNLVLIYVESLEKAYSDEKLFGRNLLQSLDKIPSFQFDQYVQVPGTGWTIAAIVSTQCAIPLKPIALPDINMQGSSIRKFLPNVTCLGDILNRHGYQNVFLGGAPEAFSGKGKFLKEHGYQKVVGKDEWLNSGKYHQEDMSSWGLHDDDLFKEAKLELDRLEEQKDHFNLTLLTLDTHFPNGHMSATCRARGGNTFQDVVECSAQEITNFIEYAKNKGYLKNTSIVVLGDHLTMTNAVDEQLKKSPNRYIFNKWISNAEFYRNRSGIVHFAIAPTILEFIGFDVQGLRIGLGHSAVYDLKNFDQKEWVKELFDNLIYSSDYYNHFWLDKKQ